MRKLIIVAFFIATTFVATGQNVAYVSFSPEDLGIGMRIDVDHAYVSMTYGNYNLPYGGYIHDHAKIAIGGMYKWFSLGMSYHHYGEVLTDQQLTKMSLKPVSVELGGRVFVGRFVACIRYDILRYEGTVDFGFLFPR